MAIGNPRSGATSVGDMGLGHVLGKEKDESVDSGCVSSAHASERAELICEEVSGGSSALPCPAVGMSASPHSLHMGTKQQLSSVAMEEA